MISLGCPGNGGSKMFEPEFVMFMSWMPPGASAAHDYLRQDKSKEKRFAFDQAFGPDVDTKTLFTATAEPLIKSVIGQQRVSISHWNFICGFDIHSKTQTFSRYFFSAFRCIYWDWGASRLQRNRLRLWFHGSRKDLHHDWHTCGAWHHVPLSRGDLQRGNHCNHRCRGRWKWG